jgi:hypothetical protein
MATIAYQGFGPATALVDSTPRPERRGMLVAFSQAVCGWRRSGHEMILKTEGTRLYLQCRHCFHESPGWEIERRPARAR